MKLTDVKNIACIGTGSMGAGVSFLCAKAGYGVKMFGRSEDSLIKGFKAIDEAAALYRKNGLLSADEVAEIKNRIKGVTSLAEAVAGADIVIESIIEDLKIKQEVFQIIEKNCRADTILTTDTSGLLPSQIADGLTDPGRFIVTHFINPPHLLPAVEIVPGPKTRDEVKTFTIEWITHIGYIPIELNQEIPGFIINRLQYACLREALYIVEKGWASAETVDAAMRYSLGRRYPVTGPIETVDLGGIETFSKVSAYLNKELCSDGGVSPFIVNAAAQKTGMRGFDEKKINALKAARAEELIEWLKKDNNNRVK